MYSDAQGLIWENVFQFPSGQHESVVWGKYAPTANEVHALGREREAKTRLRKPTMQYVGFISSTVEAIRRIRTAAGNGFSVNHKPHEGIYHAGICYSPSGKRSPQDMKKGEKGELKMALRGVFGPLVSC
jgi:hypothetical protein